MCGRIRGITMLKYALNSAQKQAVEYTAGPLLIIAGAGTGKTTVITQKFFYLISQKLAQPEEILALTFTEKAAQEMEERVDKLLASGYLELQVSTFHAFCEKLLKNYGLDIGLGNDFKILTGIDAWLLVRENLDKFDLDYYRPLGNPTRHIHELIKHFSKCKDELITPKEYLEYAKEIKLNSDSVEFESHEKDAFRIIEIANAYHTYNQLLLDNNSLDFGDLIFYAYKLFTERKNILKILQNRYKFILVDEFQDVNWAQYQLIRLLANEGLTVVGDDDQSIYAFRGASVSNILRFKEDYPDAEEIVLTENYRSGQKILDMAYKLIQNNNPDRLEAKLKINKKLKSIINDQETESFEYKNCSNLNEEVNYVINKISMIYEKESADWDDFAILVRANSQADAFIEGLELAGIPYEFLASSGLFRQPAVLDALNYLKAITNYHESSAVFRILSMKFLNISEQDLHNLIHFANRKSISLYETLKRLGEAGVSEEGRKILEKIFGLINKGAELSQISKPSVVIQHFLQDSGYVNYLLKGEKDGNRELIRQIYQLREFVDILKAYELSNPAASVYAWVEHYKYLLEAGDEGKMPCPNKTPGSVNILTVHSAKGLEFKYVFMVNLVEERFPTRRRNEAIEIPLELVKEKLPEGDSHYQEERRLFYVGITRAKNKLFLTSADDYGGARKRKISRFLVDSGFEAEKKDKTDSKTAETLMPRLQKEKTEKIVKYESSKTYSFSQLHAYEKCPYQYKLAYNLKIPVKGNANFSFGMSLHNTLQKFYARMKELNSVSQTGLFDDVQPDDLQSGKIKAPSYDELLDIYEKSWISDWYESKKQREDYFVKGREILKSFYASEADNWTMPLALECWFKIKVGDYLINGRMDRIDRSADGGLEIIDYKTGKSKEKLSEEDKEQLLIYQLAVNGLSEFKNLGRAGKLTFYYLEDNLKKSFLGNENELEKVKQRILEAVKLIESNDFTPSPSEFTCRRCDYKEICEYRHL